MTQTSPLIKNQGQLPIAWLSRSLNGLPVGENGSSVSHTQFLNHVLRLAALLPQQHYAVNVCNNRYLFMVAICAVVVREQTSLLPSNKNPATQKNLSERYANSYLLHDGAAELADDCAAFNLADVDWSLSEKTASIPAIPLEHLALICFTSGSTGDSKPNLKTWRTLRDSSEINARYMLPSSDQTYYQLATVPGQHMWGLETSVLLPLFANACLVDARPMFPQDVVSYLSKLPTPRVLISTPLHLRALHMTQSQEAGSLPPLATVLCATAPLDQSLAQSIENTFETRVREVYGCSEVGSMAVRSTSETTQWTPFEDLKFTQSNDGDTSVNAEHLPAPVVLEDTLNWVDEEHFCLSGRLSDQIKIAGKRGSLSEVNQVLSRFEGLIDGVVIFPPQDRAVPRLVALVVLQETVDKSALRAHFKLALDAAFVPRPIYVVDELPREENGKLSKQRIDALYSRLLASKRRG